MKINQVSEIMNEKDVLMDTQRNKTTGFLSREVTR